MIKRGYSDKIAGYAVSIVNRLDRELTSLNKRGNLNLIIGVITSLFAIAILVFTVIDDQVNTMGTSGFISYYVPRLGLSIFIEFFSFFFLRLYKIGLEEIKYFQNEITNIELKVLAIECAIQEEDSAAATYIIQELMTTERNFKLSKGESTVDLEKFKTDRDSNTRLIGLLANVLKANK